MKPALHFIWSPFLFSVLGFAIAWKIIEITPRNVQFSNQSVQLTQMMHVEFGYTILVALPAIGLVVGWFLAYLATPTKESDRSRLMTNSFPE